MRSDSDVENSTSFDAPFARNFRAQPDYVRCCLYLLAGGWITLALAFVFRQQAWDPTGAAMGIGLCCIAPPLLCLYVSTYRLVLDERGLARRRLMWWTVWPWEDFAAGHISKTETGCTLIHRGRPLWDRWLVPELLPAGQIHFLLELVREMSPAPAEALALQEAQPTQEMKLHWQIFPQPLTINHTGCQLANGDWLLWEEIVEFRLQANVYKGQTIRQLFVTMKQGRCHSGVVREVSWNEITITTQRSKDESWIADLQSIVPSRCWKYFRAKGDLQSVEEGQYRLRLNEKERRATRVIEIMGWVLPLLQGSRIVPGMIGVWNDPLLGLGWKILMTILAIVVTFSLTVMTQAVALQTRKHLRAGRQVIEEQIVVLVAKSNAAADLTREFDAERANSRKPNFSVVSSAAK